MAVTDQIRTATWADEKQIAAVIGLAFATDPYVRWLLPDPYKYLKANETYAGLSSGPAFDNESAFVIGDTCGAALWLPPGARVESGALAAQAKKYFDPTILNDLAELSEKSNAYRPAEPHWHLKLIAVDPVKCGMGYGAALMSHALRMCDHDKLPAYLESTNAANLSLYQRFGFELLAEVQVGRSPKRYPMLRQSLQ